MFADLQDACMLIINGESCVSMCWLGICSDFLLAIDLYLTSANGLLIFEDVSDLCPTFNNSSELRLPFRIAC